MQQVAERDRRYSRCGRREAGKSSGIRKRARRSFTTEGVRVSCINLYGCQEVLLQQKSELSVFFYAKENNKYEYRLLHEASHAPDTRSIPQPRHVGYQRRRRNRTVHLVQGSRDKFFPEVPPSETRTNPPFGASSRLLKKGQQAKWFAPEIAAVARHLLEGYSVRLQSQRLSTRPSLYLTETSCREDRIHNNCCCRR